ncbi:hypothetical protein HDU85_004232 [Gaertneriomyces sp. JEL0708]|nr:hypothetical protein HDU85_004232 [Gaertneriomyces sp. JEL0708]
MRPKKSKLLAGIHAMDQAIAKGPPKKPGKGLGPLSAPFKKLKEGFTTALGTPKNPEMETFFIAADRWMKSHTPLKETVQAGLLEILGETMREGTGKAPANVLESTIGCLSKWAFDGVTSKEKLGKHTIKGLVDCLMSQAVGIVGKRQAAEALNFLMTQSKENKAVLKDASMHAHLQELGKSLRTLGDVELQLQVVEVLFRLCPKHKVERIHFAESITIGQKFADIRGDMFHEDARALLNAINAHNDGVKTFPRSFQVRSFKCVLDGQESLLQLQPPMQSELFWLDFSRICISASAAIEGEEGILTIEITYDKIQQWRTERLPDGLELYLTLNDPITLASPQGSQDAISCSTQTLILFLPAGEPIPSFDLRLSAIFDHHKVPQTKMLKMSVPMSKPLPARTVSQEAIGWFDDAEPVQPDDERHESPIEVVDAASSRGNGMECETDRGNKDSPTGNLRREQQVASSEPDRSICSVSELTEDEEKEEEEEDDDDDSYIGSDDNPFLVRPGKGRHEGRAGRILKQALSKAGEPREAGPLNKQSVTTNPRIHVSEPRKHTDVKNLESSAIDGLLSLEPSKNVDSARKGRTPVWEKSKVNKKTTTGTILRANTKSQKGPRLSPKDQTESNQPSASSVTTRFNAFTENAAPRVLFNTNPQLFTAGKRKAFDEHRSSCVESVPYKTPVSLHKGPAQKRVRKDTEREDVLSSALGALSSSDRDDDLSNMLSVPGIKSKLLRLLGSTVNDVNLSSDDSEVDEGPTFVVESPVDQRQRPGGAASLASFTSKKRSGFEPTITMKIRETRGEEPFEVDPTFKEIEKLFTEIGQLYTSRLRRQSLRISQLAQESIARLGQKEAVFITNASKQALNLVKELVGQVDDVENEIKRNMKKAMEVIGPTAESTKRTLDKMADLVTCNNDDGDRSVSISSCRKLPTGTNSRVISLATIQLDQSTRSVKSAVM